MNYYTSYSSMLNYYDKHSRELGYNCRTPQEHTQWKNRLTSKLIKLLGIDKIQTIPMNYQLIETWHLDGYSRLKYIVETEDGVWMPFYQLIPDNKQSDRKLIPVLALHGHNAFAKEGVAGAYDKIGNKYTNYISKYHASYGLDLVKEGFMVFCPDARGGGERREHLNQGERISDIIGSSCNSLNNAAIAMGMSLTGFWTWDFMRLMDFIYTLKDCDTDELSVVGFSGGGLSALWLSALDQRIRKTVVSGYYHSYRGTILRTNQCGCNYVPNLYNYIDICDLGALIAPRKLLIETGNKDPLNGERGVDDVIEQVKITKQAYMVHNKENNMLHKIYDGGHRWYGYDVVPFLKGF